MMVRLELTEDQASLLLWAISGVADIEGFDDGFDYEADFSPIFGIVFDAARAAQRAHG